ncbi:hypothetical protein OH491_00110 [Termitidicoccus mucosus]|uniref:hypothetical protein n=1 Tax=Termitidicoccus mucosus TaxID=1184151 RepID=UPI002FEE1D8C
MNDSGSKAAAGMVPTRASRQASNTLIFIFVSLRGMTVFEQYDVNAILYAFRPSHHFA